MRKTFAYCLIAASTLLLYGCPYHSNIPLGDASEKVKDRLLGTWVPESETENENPSYYEIARQDMFLYAIGHFQFSDSAYDSKQYVAHTTSFGETMFMNMKEKDTWDYLLYRIDMTDSTLVMFEVTDNIDEEFSDTEEMQAFFKKHMGLSFFYNRDEVTLVRKEK